jgi:hypothetical protein
VASNPNITAFNDVVRIVLVCNQNVSREREVTGSLEDMSMERICMTICTKLRGFKVRNISAEMNCRNLSSRVFS